MSTLEDIAIVGMSGLFPKAPDIDVFWSNILNKVDAVTDSPEGWLGNGDIFDPTSDDISKIYTRKGGFLGDLGRFDARAFGTMPLSIEGSQPDQFLALKLAHDALVDAGMTPGQFDGTKTGVILGMAVHAHRANTNGIQQFWFEPQMREIFTQLFPGMEPERIEAALELFHGSVPKIAPDAVPGLIPNILTGRIANRLDLMGPNYIIDAACASTLITIDLAMNELRSGNADVMLAGGINTTTSPLVYAVFCSVDALSRDGLIRPFGQESSGTVLGEGAGIIVLKRLSDALDNGDRIHAVVKGSGQSSDGKSSGLMAPRREGAELAVRRAYEGSGIDPSTIGLVEAHGTGISLGEKVEVDALRGVFGEGNGSVPQVAIGSVKSMIGHCIPAAGSASVIKTVLALQNRVIPPTLAGEVSSESGLESTPFYVAEEARPWIQSSPLPRRAAVNSFGFGGINAHLILEESPVGRERDPTTAFFRPVPEARPAEQVFAFAGKDQADLRETLVAFSVPDQSQFANVSAALLQDAKGPARLAIVSTTPDDLAKKIKTAAQKLEAPDAASMRTRNGIYYEPAPIDGKIVFLFPGEMAQYTDMLKEATRAIPAIREWFEDISSISEDRRDVRLQDVIYPPDNMITDEARQALGGLMHQVDYGSEMVFAADQAIAATLRAVGIEPDSVLGHSTGENAALVASGKLALDRPGVLNMIADMNVAFDEVAEDGSVPNGVLLTVAALDNEKLAQICTGFPDIHFTMDNCPNQAILFGSDTDMDQLQEKVAAEGAICTRLPISWGYHTEFVRPMAEKFRKLFADIEHQDSPITLWSCVTAQPFPTGRDEIIETAVSQYVSKVRFTDSILNLYEDGHRIFIECGPGSNLTAFVGDILGDKPYLAVSADNKRRGFLPQLKHLIAQVFVTGRDLQVKDFITPPEHSDAKHRQESTAAHLAAPALPSNLPSFRMEPEFAEKIRQTLFGQDGTQAVQPMQDTAPTQAPVQAPIQQTQTAAAPAGAVNGQSAAAAQPAPRAATGVTSAQSSRAVVGHFNLMNQFLKGQDRVMQSALGAANPAAAGPSTGPSTSPSTGRDTQQIKMLDIAPYFALPFEFRAYLMQGYPNFENMMPYLSSAEVAEAEAAASVRVERWQEWSLSRLAVKRAAAEILALNLNMRPEESSIEVCKDPNGAPYVAAREGWHVPNISISHVRAIGLGAASTPGFAIGLDHELTNRIRDPKDFLETILSPEEASRIAPANDSETAVSLWSLKEAAAKAIGVGLQGRPQEFVLTDVDASGGSAIVTYGSHRVPAQVRKIGNGVCTIAYREVVG